MAVPVWNEFSPDPDRVLSSFTSTLRPQLERARARDLLRVGEAAFLADRAHQRGWRLGQRTRALKVTVPVEEPAVWRSATNLLESLASFISCDHWRFAFTKLPHEGDTRHHELSPQGSSSVCLFSGGLDSLCGAAAALRRGETPVFVTHNSPALSVAQQRIRALQRAVGVTRVTPQFAHFALRVVEEPQGREGNRFAERSRRTRPLLFLAMAGAIAIDYAIPKICLNENGVLSMNLPLRPDLHGQRASRHAHPQTLRGFEQLLRSIWPHEGSPYVVNPLLQYTKGEQLQTLKGRLGLTGDTVSCEYAGQQVARLKDFLATHRIRHQTVRECGLCFPCLVRRAALNTRGADQPERYVFDARVALRNPRAYSEYPLFSTLATNVPDLLAFCTGVMQAEPTGFVLDYVFELSMVTEPQTARTGAAMMYDIHRRFAREFLKYIRS